MIKHLMLKALVYLDIYIISLCQNVTMSHISTVEHVQDNHCWDHSKGGWSSLQIDHKPNLVVLGRVLVFIPIVNVL